MNTLWLYCCREIAVMASNYGHVIVGKRLSFCVLFILDTHSLLAMYN